MCGDLTYDILHCDTWDPNTLGSPHSSKIKEPSPSDDHISFMAEKLLDVSVPIDGYGKIDIFIDNGIAVMTPDIGRYDSITLPTKKFRRWDHDLSNILTRKKTSLS